MRRIWMITLASVLAGLLLLAALPASASAGLAGWQYQREITIHENSGETLRDYQVLVALAGGDFPEEAQPDGDDIRFTDADGRELSYWIEEFDAGSKRAVIWVKVPMIPANGEAGVAMWYGNPGAESGSDGEAVFEFFDDFEDTSLDTSKWNFDGNPSVTDSVVIITGTADGKIKSKNTYLRPIIFEYYAKMTTAGSCNYFGFFNGVDDSAFVHDSYGYFVGDVHGASGWIELARSHSLSEYRLWKVVWTEGEVRFYTDDNFDISTTSYVPDDAVKAWARNDREDAEDHTLTLPITVRAEPEQTVDTSGSKEKGSSTPGFVAVVAVIGLLAAYLRRRI